MNLLLKLNVIINFFRRLRGKEYWSLAKFLKYKVKMQSNILVNMKKQSQIMQKEKNLMELFVATSIMLRIEILMGSII